MRVLCVGEKIKENTLTQVQVDVGIVTLERYQEALTRMLVYARLEKQTQA